MLNWISTPWGVRKNPPSQLHLLTSTVNPRLIYCELFSDARMAMYNLLYACKISCVLWFRYDLQSDSNYYVWPRWGAFQSLGAHFCQAILDNLEQRFPGTKVLDPASWPDDPVDNALFGGNALVQLCKKFYLSATETADFLFEFAQYKKGKKNESEFAFCPRCILFQPDLARWICSIQTLGIGWPFRRSVMHSCCRLMGPR